MDSITQNKRYLPHEISTKINSVKLYRQTKDIGFVCRRYHISKASLMRWNKQYDGTKESLEPKSHKPLTPHPNSHTEEELKWIKDYHRRNPNISICELYGKLREEKAYSRHPGSLYRVRIQTIRCKADSIVLLFSDCNYQNSKRCFFIDIECRIYGNRLHECRNGQTE